MLLYSFLKTITEKEIVIELKNDLKIRGTLKSVDQFHNIRIDDIQIMNLDQYPHLAAVKSLFVRGPSIRYVYLPKEAVDVDLLQEASRREALNAKIMAN
ncbi:Sm-like protein [Starmerella bacillaris]|uniref:Sm-like protein n=1 Tax=Starmerella bacillaris TaxID=1247836 RepID=A0AAV5RE84_STABA|nr:Sm-like protein [Starmerella bacillaris]